MIMKDYSKFDAALLAAIGTKPQNFTEITTTRELAAMAAALATPDRWGYKNVDRVFDRRLQALRRAGKIRYAGTKWVAIGG